MSGVPVQTQVLNALRATVIAADTAAAGRVFIGRGDDDPFQPNELPAINLLPINEAISVDTVFGGAVGTPLLQQHQFDVVLQIVSRGGAEAENTARLIGAECAAAVAADPSLGGLCNELVRPTARQWLRDDGVESRVARENAIYSAGFRTYNTDPFTAV